MPAVLSRYRVILWYEALVSVVELLLQFKINTLEECYAPENVVWLHVELEKCQSNLPQV